MAILRVHVDHDTLNSRTPSPSPIASGPRNNFSGVMKPLLVKSPSQSSLASLSQARLQPLSSQTRGPYKQTSPVLVGSPGRALRRSSSCSAGYRGLGTQASCGMMENHEMVIKTFKAFCGCQRNTLDSVAFCMLCRQCFLIDVRFSEDDAAAVFRQVVAQGENHMSYFQFESALTLVAQKRGVSMGVLHPAIALCGGPHPQALAHNGAGSRRSGIHEPGVVRPCHHSGKLEGQAEDAEDVLVSAKIKAQSAFFKALCSEEEHSENVHEPSLDIDPNLALKVKAQAALLQILCASDENHEDEEEEPTEVYAMKVRAQGALIKALGIDERLYENAGVEHDDVDYLKANARDALNALAASETHHGHGDLLE